MEKVVGVWVVSSLGMAGCVDMKGQALEDGIYLTGEWTTAM